MSQVRDDVLNGWKEIAAYLGRDPRTVERWEKTRSLPVRRVPGGGRSTVFAFTAELDRWLDQPLDLSSSGTSHTATELTATSPQSKPVPSLQPGPAQRPFQAAVDAAVPISAKKHSLALWAFLSFCLFTILSIVLIHQRATGRSAPAVASPQTRGFAHASAVAGVEGLYLRGWYQMELRTPESLSRAQDAFHEASQRDPGYAPAFAGLACTYLLVREYTTEPEAQEYQLASDAANKAIALDPDLPEAHAALGFIDFFWRWNATQAETEFQHALRLDPKLALAHHWYGSMLTHQGRFGEALDQLGTAQHIEPGSAAILTTRALALGLGGHREESSMLLNEAVAVEAGGTYRGSATMHQVMGILSLLNPRDVPRFLSENTLAAALRRDSAAVRQWRVAAGAFERRGERGMWEELLAVEQRKAERAAPTYALARYQAELGATQEALATLEGLLARHDPALIGMAIDPLLSGCKTDPRFRRMLAALGLRAS